jgi:hypothetical protein
MTFNPGMRFEMNAGLYGGFAAALHGEARFHGGDDFIIGQCEARNVGPIQEINMDGRAFGMVHGGGTFTMDLWNLVSSNRWGSSRAGIISMRLAKFRRQAGAKND